MGKEILFRLGPHSNSEVDSLPLTLGKTIESSIQRNPNGKVAVLLELADSESFAKSVDQFIQQGFSTSNAYLYARGYREGGRALREEELQVNRNILRDKPGADRFFSMNY